MWNFILVFSLTFTIFWWMTVGLFIPFKVYDHLHERYDFSELEAGSVGLLCLLIAPVCMPYTIWLFLKGLYLGLRKLWRLTWPKHTDDDVPRAVVRRRP